MTSGNRRHAILGLGSRAGGLMENKVLYDRYRTIAYERANPVGQEEAARQLEPTYGKILPKDLGAHILDIGCGMGQFLCYLKKKGYHNLMGVDISPEQVECCKKNVIEEVELIDDIVSFLRERSGRWDCIAMLDVIEHLPRGQVIPALAAIHGALKEGGTLLLSTGNLASATGPFLRYIDFTHESGFTENSLRQVLRAVGFSKIDVMATSPAICSWRSWFLILAQKVWQACWRLVYRLERSWDSPPEVLSNTMIACAQK